MWNKQQTHGSSVLLSYANVRRVSLRREEAAGLTHNPSKLRQQGEHKLFRQTYNLRAFFTTNFSSGTWFISEHQTYFDVA